MRVLFCLLLFCALPLMAQDRCHDVEPCQLGGRSYHVKEPDGWDGRAPLPVLLHFHGWGRQGDLIVRHDRIFGATRRRDVLLVAPNGRGKSWDFWQAGTTDVAFARAVLEDIRARYPVDADQVFVSGYSWGAAMAWRFVCDDGSDIAALLSISGTIEPTAPCATAPKQVRHVHGLDDRVMDFPTGPNGDQTWPVKLWRDRLECGLVQEMGTWQAVSFLTHTRMAWQGCQRGDVFLDVHPGGHFIPHGWIARQLDELAGRAPRYP